MLRYYISGMDALLMHALLYVTMSTNNLYDVNRLRRHVVSCFIFSLLKQDILIRFASLLCDFRFETAIYFSMNKISSICFLVPGVILNTDFLGELI